MAAPRTLRGLHDPHLTEIASAPKLRERLALMGSETGRALVQHYPRRYHDRTQQAEIVELSVGQEATVLAEVRRIRSRYTRNRRAIVDAVVYDGTDLLNIVFFNQPWRERQ